MSDSIRRAKQITRALIRNTPLATWAIDVQFKDLSEDGLAGQAIWDDGMERGRVKVDPGGVSDIRPMEEIIAHELGHMLVGGLLGCLNVSDAGARDEIVEQLASRIGLLLVQKTRDLP